MQWCGVPALCVSAVDVFRAAEFLHSSQTALLGGIQQGGVSTQQVLDVRVSVLHHVQSHVAITVLLRWVSAMLKRELICQCKRGCVTLLIIIINPKTAKNFIFFVIDAKGIISPLTNFKREKGSMHLKFIGFIEFNQNGS